MAEEVKERQKGGKRPHKYAKSKETRYFLTARRKDLNVKKSSKGMFHSVQDLETGTRRRPIPA